MARRVKIKQVYGVRPDTWSRTINGVYLDYSTAVAAAESFGQTADDLVVVPLLDTPADLNVMLFSDLDDWGSMGEVEDGTEA